MSSSAERLQALFRGSSAGHGKMWFKINGQKKRASTLKCPTFLQDYEDHISGKGMIGIGEIPLDSDGNCGFGAIDADNHKRKLEVDLAELQRRVTKHKLPLVVCRSKSRGGHLFLFLAEDESIEADIIITRLKGWAKLLGVSEVAGVDDVEFYPKQVKAEVGNWINLPYYDATGDEPAICDRW